jgi:hypothetical protein
MTPDTAQHVRICIDDDPPAWGEMLAAIYRDVGERSMRDLPIFNEALGVEAIGFQRFGGHVVGIMVTPWFMNVIARADEGALAAHRPGLNSPSARLHRQAASQAARCFRRCSNSLTWPRPARRRRRHSMR